MLSWFSDSNHMSRSLTDTSRNTGRRLQQVSHDKWYGSEYPDGVFYHMIYIIVEESKKGRMVSSAMARDYAKLSVSAHELEIARKAQNLSRRI